MRMRAIGFALCLGLAGMGSCLTETTAEAAWQPSKPVEFVIPWAAGGGSDVMARKIAAIVDQEKLAPAPLVVINKVGGNTLVALSYVMGKKGDGHTLLFAGWSNLMAPVMEKLAFGLRDTTPICRYAIDEQLYYVKADSPFKTLADLAAAAKKTPGAIKVGGAVVGSEDHVTNYLFETAAGVKLNYIAHRSGGDIMRELLGGHVDVGLQNPSEAAAQYEGKLVRPLAVASAKRLAGMPDVPTFKEMGYDMVVEASYRGVQGAPGISPEVAGYYMGLMQRVMQSPKWAAFVKENMLTSVFMGGKEYANYLEGQEQLVRRTLAGMGLMKP